VRENRSDEDSVLVHGKPIMFVLSKLLKKMDDAEGN